MLLDAVSVLQEEGIVDISEYHNYYGGLSYRHKFVMDPSGCSYDLPNRAKFVASFILDRLGMKIMKGLLILLIQPHQW